ncbi:Two component system response regulator, sigma54-specific [Desulfonema limicola]|uniref:Two component system response regulator, sigma54-specific n=1 Tax=Desulfonema limicola TaxID=45656 RepID=A0A975BD85_9BACT|nr:sigma-54 dependent transcriptional regulator [Desulfonema limicola]QTA83207.1 Two component system response regulator, sigma54-specific [Desulfonema limicola]
MISYIVYLVDDEPGIRKGISFRLKKLYQITTFPDAESAIEAIKSKQPDLVLLDIGLPGMSGIEALEHIKKNWPEILVIMATAYEDIKTVISAMKLGAHDYIVKPIHMDSLKVTLKNALETIKMRKEIQALQASYIKENLPFFVGKSNAIQDVMNFVDKVAKSPDAPVLILGESGTGKELIASAIHYKSPNYQGPFVTINCASIPKELIESELFGYEKGAFSGAKDSGKKGLVEEAENGTLFLDEVGDLGMEAQAKLLRFLEDGEYYRVGGVKKLRLSLRVVSATNKNMEQMAAQGSFREDLYYRLAVVTIKIPSLNERQDDIIPIANYFLMEFGKKYKKNFQRLSPETQAFLLNYEWKGNIREMKNIIERGVLIGECPELKIEHIGLKMSDKNSVQSRKKEEVNPFGALPEEGIDLNALEEHYIREAYKKSGNNDAKAARLLNMSYYSFRYKKKKFKDL